MPLLLLLLDHGLPFLEEPAPEQEKSNKKSRSQDQELGTWWGLRCLRALCTRRTEMISKRRRRREITQADTATKCSIFISITVAPWPKVSTTKV